MRLKNAAVALVTLVAILHPSAGRAADDCAACIAKYHADNASYETAKWWGHWTGVVSGVGACMFGLTGAMLMPPSLILTVSACALPGLGSAAILGGGAFVASTYSSQAAAEAACRAQCNPATVAPASLRPSHVAL